MFYGDKDVEEFLQSYKGRNCIVSMFKQYHSGARMYYKGEWVIQLQDVASKKELLKVTKKLDALLDYLKVQFKPQGIDNPEPKTDIIVKQDKRR